MGRLREEMIKAVKGVPLKDVPIVDAIVQKMGWVKGTEKLKNRRTEKQWRGSADLTFNQSDWSDGADAGAYATQTGLIYWHRNTSLRFKFTLDGLIHPLGKTTRNPDFSTLVTGLDRDIFEEIKMSFYQPVKRCLLPMQSTTTLCTQRIFHGIFSLLVLGSSHLAGSIQWTVMI